MELQEEKEREIELMCFKLKLEVCRCVRQNHQSTKIVRRQIRQYKLGFHFCVCPSFVTLTVFMQKIVPNFQDMIRLFLWTWFMIVHALMQ